MLEAIRIRPSALQSAVSVLPCSEQFEDGPTAPKNDLRSYKDDGGSVQDVKLSWVGNSLAGRILHIRNSREQQRKWDTEGDQK